MWPLAVLTGDRINEGFFFIRNCMAVLPGQKKVAVKTRCPYYRGGRNVPVKSKLQHPPPPPGHLKFWKINVQIPPSPSQIAVQMPPPRGNKPFHRDFYLQICFLGNLEFGTIVFHSFTRNSNYSRPKECCFFDSVS